MRVLTHVHVSVHVCDIVCVHACDWISHFFTSRYPYLYLNLIYTCTRRCVLSNDPWNPQPLSVPSPPASLPPSPKALHALGLRVVLDVVYNHTFASGPHSRCSVLDKLVPGYYHRRAEDGDMCHRHAHMRNT